MLLRACNCLEDSIDMTSCSFSLPSRRAEILIFFAFYRLGVFSALLPSDANLEEGFYFFGVCCRPILDHFSSSILRVGFCLYLLLDPNLNSGLVLGHDLKYKAAGSWPRIDCHFLSSSPHSQLESRAGERMKKGRVRIPKMG